MESKIYELILVAVPVNSEAQEKLYSAIDNADCAMGMQVDLEDNTEADLFELMTNIMAEGASKYGLQTN